MGLHWSKASNTNKKVNRKGVQKSKITDHDRAMLDLKNARDRLKRYQKKLLSDSDKLTAQAMEMVKAGKKDRALLVLKVKKFKQKECDKADAQLLIVEQMIETVSFETEQMKVFEALKQGNVILDKLNQEMPVEMIEELLADTAEAVAVQEEISRTLAGDWLEESGDELADEYAALEAEFAEAEIKKLPEAPVTTEVETAEVSPPVEAVATAISTATSTTTSTATSTATSTQAATITGEVALTLPEVPTHIPVLPESATTPTAATSSPPSASTTATTANGQGVRQPTLVPA